MAGASGEPGARLLKDIERAVVEIIPLDVDCARVRLYEPGCPGTAGRLRRLTLLASRNRAIALGNHIFLPDRCHGDLAVLAHELTHAGQYQRWGPVVYFMRGIAEQVRDLLYRRFGIGASPYRYRIIPGKPFSAYGMEQQAQIVEDLFRSRQWDQVVPSA